jgi:1-aminocyclopropane-1-carboxylate deaminase/D-cysteine desulfhydrase-like pyridoxal-dependent ACC family enzyme
MTSLNVLKGSQAFIAFALIVATNTIIATPAHLLTHYPKLKETVGHVELGLFPTPIQKLDKLGELLQTPQLYIKKDSISGELFGGNKVRKLEFLLGEAIFHHAKGVVTRGYAGSNHTCATAAYAQKLGLECLCLHTPQIPTTYLRRNLLLSYKNGAELHLYRNAATRTLAMMKLDEAFNEKNGIHLYSIPSGGSNEVGVLGFINAIYELKEQITQGIMPEPDFLYVVLGSCGTAAGLIIGTKLLGLKTKIIPVCIEPDAIEKEHETKLADLVELTSIYLNKRDPLFPVIGTKDEDFSINYDFIGKDYGVITPEDKAAIQLLEQTEGIKLDGTYTGKAFAALIHDIATKPELKNKVILFWDSFCSGDFADIIKHVDYHQLPKEYHQYFECALQPDDQGV